LHTGGIARLEHETIEAERWHRPVGADGQAVVVGEAARDACAGGAAGCVFVVVDIACIGTHVYRRRAQHQQELASAIVGRGAGAPRACTPTLQRASNSNQPAR
jgi:hypothetical protein